MHHGIAEQGLNEVIVCKGAGFIDVGILGLQAAHMEISDRMVKKARGFRTEKIRAKGKKPRPRKDSWA